MVSSDIVSRVAMAAQKTYIKNNRAKIGFNTTPLLELCEEVKESHAVSGQDGEIIDGVTTMPELNSQFWRGDDTIINAQDINGDIAFATQYFRDVLPVKLQHDEWLQKGYDIVPHMDGSIESRVKKIGKAGLEKLHDDLVQHEMGKVNARFNDNLEIALWRQGASSKEPVGVNAWMNLVPTGLVYGQDRAVVPEMRHYVVGSQVGVSGTLLTDLATMFRVLGERSANCGMSGEWVPIAGSDWLTAYRQECERSGIQRNTEMAGVKKMDGVVLDSALMVGTLKPRYAFTLDRLDTIAVSERGVYLSNVTATFSGGGATRQATALVLVNGAGQIADIIIVDGGAGYTSAPTLTLGNVGGGTGATFACLWFGTGGAATGKQIVATDDFRVGRLADVTISAVGSGYTAGDAPTFSKRCYFIFKPGLKYKIAKGGNGPIERRVTVPADPARSRSSEFQIETVAYFYHRALQLNALSYIK
jgi:hypothetical protein